MGETLDKLYQMGHSLQKMEKGNPDAFKSYMSTPQVVGFNRWKEEAAKFIISGYFNGQLWLEQPIAITPGLIQKITSFPSKGDPVPKTTDPRTWIQKCIGSRMAKNSKGSVISQVIDQYVKWVCI